MKKFEQFGKVIRDIRVGCELTQREFGEKAETSSQVISNTERGLAALPKYTVQKIFKKHNVDLKTRRRLIDALALDMAKHTRHDWAKTLKAGG